MENEKKKKEARTSELGLQREWRVGATYALVHPVEDTAQLLKTPIFNLRGKKFHEDREIHCLERALYHAVGFVDHQKTQVLQDFKLELCQRDELPQTT